MPDGVSQRIHDIIQTAGFGYHIEWRYDLSTVIVDDRVQIRAETEVNKQHVRSLTESYKAGAKIDLIAVTADQHLAFGNHRLPAMKAAGMNHGPVIVIEANAADADDDVMRALRIVGIRENSSHGLQNSKATKEMATVLFREDGWDNTRISRELGVPGGRVGEIIAVDKGRKALDKLGVDPATLTKTAVGALGRASDELNRGPFAELARLAADARMTKTEINSLAKVAKEIGSDDDAVKLIEEQRTNLNTRVTGVDTGHPPFPAQLRQKLGFIIGKEGNPQVLVEHSPASRDEHLRMVNASIAVLEAVRDLMADGQLDLDTEDEDAA